MSVLDKLYHYKFRVDRVIDGDTIEGRRDNGNNNFDEKVKVRLLGIQAPEISKAKTLEEKTRGYAAKAYLESLIKGKEVVIKTSKAKDDDSFGRVLADIYLLSGTDIHINQLMMISGHAVEYDK